MAGGRSRVADHDPLFKSRPMAEHTSIATNHGSPSIRVVLMLTGVSDEVGLKVNVEVVVIEVLPATLR
jgi:hypothetical protein